MPTSDPHRPGRSISIIPLGGVGEVGKNAAVVESQRDLLLVDAGVMFPEEELLGIDLVIPDFSYVLSHADRLRGILLTHGHEDHIGALPFLLRQLGRRIPIYGLPLTLGLTRPKLQEHRVADLADLRLVTPNEPISLGGFQVSFVPVSHSIPDSASLAIRGPAGVLFFTGDFKLSAGDNGARTDPARLQEIGDEGVLALLSDCVRVDRPGRTPPERVVAETLDEIIRDAPGRVIITTFASNITRMRQAIERGYRHGRKTAVVGRSMLQNLQVAEELGYLRVPPDALVAVEETRGLPADQVVLLTTGSQGEPTSALSRIAVGDHSVIKLIPGDTVVIAATPVPGNEETVARTIDNLLRREATVIYPAIVETVHVSGHASRDELREVIELLRPRFCIPIHGEYRHLVLYRDLAVETGLPPERVVLPEVGERIELTPDAIRRRGHIPAGSVLVDGLTVGNVTNVVLRDRRHLAEDGVLIAAVAVDRETGELVGGPDLIARGFAFGDESLLVQATGQVRRALKRRPNMQVEYGYLVARIKEVLGHYIYEATRTRPMILPVVTEV
ncbi:MAG: ribonuclease J [Chloroflexi bacterium]|nr:ribonuclease J [Chloroflexota bacterium]